MFQTLRVFPRLSMRPLAFLITLAGSACAQADANPYYIGVRQEFVRESNVFRTAARLGDTVSSTGLLAGIDQPFGRQRFYADMSLLANRYQNYSELNNFSHSETAGLDWSSMERLSGTLHYLSRQDLADFGLTSGSTAKNMQHTQQASASARYGLATRLGLEGSVEHSRVDFSNNAFNTGEFSQNAASLGLRWGASGLLTLGAGLRATHGEYPHYKDPFDPLAPETPDRMRRRDLDLTAVWSPTGLSTFNARASSTRETHSQVSRPGFSGLTGALGWDYRLTGKLTIKTQLTRDTGSEATFLTVAPGSLPQRSDNNRLTTLAELGASYEATAKIGLTANLRRTHGSIASTSGASLGDSTSSVSFGAKYQPTRSISLGCNAGREHHVNVYNAYTAGCAAQLTLK